MPGFLGGSTSGSSGTSGEITFPKEFIDPVTKLRVSTPQTMIDTDFEYGLQPTKWETVELINNTPSFFSKGGDTTIPNITSITTNVGTREITVNTLLDHGLSVGIPINVTGTKSVTADGAYIIASIPTTTSFTYLCKDNQPITQSIEDLYTSIITGEFFQGSQIRVSDSAGITTDGTSISTLTVTTDSAHGFKVDTPFYFLNLNSTISQEFQAANTTAKSFDSSNSATAQTFDGSNTLSSINIDWSNSATVGGVTSSIASVNTTADTITVTHTTENFVGKTIGTPLYYNVVSATGFFATNPRGVVFIKSLVSSTSGSSTFTVSDVPDGTTIDLTSSMAGTFQLANQARTFAGNNINLATQFQLDLVSDTAKVFDGANENGPVTTVSIYGSNGLIQVANDAGGSVALNWSVNTMLQYTTTGSAATGLTANNTYWIKTVTVPSPASAGLVNITVSATPGGAAITTVTGGSGTQKFTQIGVSIDTDYFYLPNNGYTVGDMLKYSYPTSGAITVGGSDQANYYYVESVADTANFKVSRTKGGILPNNGSTAAQAAPSALYLKDTLGITTSGFYWIKPTGYSGSALFLYCDMTNSGGGWVLVAKGRQVADDGAGWFGNNSDYNVSELQNAGTLLSPTVAKVNGSFINYLMNGTASGWDNARSTNELLANRRSDCTDGRGGPNDSFRLKVLNQTTFTWNNQFGHSTPVDNPGSVVTGTGFVGRYTSLWKGGSLQGSVANAQMYDNDFGTPGNDVGRSFQWHWGQHGAYHGWSAGSTYGSGFVNGSEGHPIQYVQAFVR